MLFTIDESIIKETLGNQELLEQKMGIKTMDILKISKFIIT